jgi:hypothetical protein
MVRSEWALKVYNSNELGLISTEATYIVYTTSLGGGRGTSTGAVAQTFLALGLVTPSRCRSQYKKAYLTRALT